HAGEQRDLLPAQSRGAAAARALGETDVGGTDRLAAAAKEVGELLALHGSMEPRGGPGHPGSGAPTMNAPLSGSRAGTQGRRRHRTRENEMRTRTLGRTGPEVSALGLGAMGMSDAYGPTDRAESIATVHAALDAGVTLIDTGDFYGMGHNELLLA